jgi:hypothetical protein
MQWWHSCYLHLNLQIGLSTRGNGHLMLSYSYCYVDGGLSPAGWALVVMWARVETTLSLCTEHIGVSNAEAMH